MPHIVVKLGSGRPEAQKQQLAGHIAQSVLDVLHCEDAEISVAIEDVAKDDWMTQVFAPEIQAKQRTLYKKPGYGPELSDKE